MKSKIIAVAVPKGGVGKTTTSVNLAASLAVAEKKTLLIDVDPAGACSLSLGLKQEDIKGDIFNVFSFKRSFEQVIHKTLLKYLDFIPSNVISYQEEERLTRLTGNKYLFRNLLQQEGFGYDYVIIDCPPYLRGMTTNALTSANSVIVPVKSGNFSVAALEKLFNHVQWVKENLNSALSIEGILLTMYEMNTKDWQLTEKQISANFGGYLFKTVIPKSSVIAESTFYGTPAVLFKASAKGAKAYLKLAREVLVRNKPCPVEEIVPRKIDMIF